MVSHIIFDIKPVITTDENKIKAGECDAFDVMSNVMKTHLNNINVCKFGCGVLRSITANGICLIIMMLILCIFIR